MSIVKRFLSEAQSNSELHPEVVKNWKSHVSENRPSDSHYAAYMGHEDISAHHEDMARIHKSNGNMAAAKAHEQAMKAHEKASEYHGINPEEFSERKLKSYSNKGLKVSSDAMHATDAAHAHPLDYSKSFDKLNDHAKDVFSTGGASKYGVHKPDTHLNSGLEGEPATHDEYIEKLTDHHNDNYTRYNDRMGGYESHAINN